MIAALWALGACATRSEPAGGLTLAVHDGSHWVAVAWDGETARTFRDGRPVDTYPAASRVEALWGCRPGDLGPAKAARTWDRTLAPDELAALDLCALDAAACP